MCGGVADIIKCAKFFENPSKGFVAVRPRITAFPIEIVHRPYNSVGTTVPNCDMTSGGNNFNCFAENQLSKFSARDAEDFSDA